MKPLLILAICLPLSTCLAQHLMPRIGASVSTVRLPNVPDFYNTSYATGFLTGISSRYDLGDRMGIMGDLLFTQKGWKASIETVDPTGKQSDRIFYGELLALPYVKWRKMFFMAGPGLSYGLFGKSHLVVEYANGQTSSNESHVRFNELDDPQSSDTYMDRRLTFNWQVGVGIKVLERILIDLRYQEAMMDHHSPMPPSQRPTRVPAGWYQSFQLTTAFQFIRD